MRILVVQSVSDDQKPWWFQYLPRASGECEVTLACEPRYARDGWRAYWKLSKLYVLSNQYDVVVTLQDGNATFLFSFLNRFRFSKPYRHVVHEFITRERERMSPVRAWLKYSFLKISLSSVDKIICSANAEASYYQEILGFASSKLDFVPLSCDPQLLERPQLPKSDYIVSAGRTGRDYRTFLDAVRGLPVDVKIIAGKGALDGMSVPPNVKTYFDIPQAEFIDILASSLFVVVPLEDRRISIGQSVVLQAMGLGKALVTTDIAATRDYVENGVDGILVPPHDDLALRSAIESLLASEDVVDKIGDAARKKIRESFLPQLAIPKIGKIIQSLLRG